MRVLLVTDWPRIPAGTERYVDTVAAALRDAGDEAELMCSATGVADGGRARFVAPASDRPGAQAFLQVANPGALRTLRRALREFRPDVVHLAMFLPYMSPLVMAPLAGVRTTMTVIDFKPLCPVGTKLLPDGSQCHDPAGRACFANGCLGPGRAAREALRYGGFRAGLANVDRVFACSHHVARELAMIGIESEALPLASPLPATFPRNPGPDPHFVYAGRLAPVKGVELLLETFARLLADHPAAKLEIHGDGPLRGTLMNRAGLLGIGRAVSFSPAMSEGWFESLEGAWALVAPSTYREPLGLVAIEAIGRGVPVIASRRGGFSETVDDGVTGLLFENGDGDGLLACLEAVCRGDGPGPILDPAAVAALTERHDVDRHMRELRRAWNGAAR